MEQKNIILALVLSVVVLFGWQMVFEPPQPQKTTVTSKPSPDLTPDINTEKDDVLPRKDVLQNSTRLSLINEKIKGSISTKGLRFDDIILSDYRETLNKTSDQISLLSPLKTKNPYFVEFGWVSNDKTIPLPDQNTIWSVNSTKELTPKSPLELSWDNGQGLLFKRTISVDDQYLITVDDQVENKSQKDVTLYPYALTSRYGTPETEGFFILHEGPIAFLNDTLEEFDYDDLQDESVIEKNSKGGWLGITDKYWLVAIIPDQKNSVKTRFSHSIRNNTNKYQVDYLGSAFEISPGNTQSYTNHLFAGAKKVNLLDQYAKEYDIKHLDLAVDFGWFYFLTKPFFLCLKWINSIVGNFGISILIFTVLIKLVFFPLANKSYNSMSKMRLLQPEMLKIRETYKDDRLKMNQAMMDLYKKEKVNPASGCLPILIQIPVFFALYKVLFVTIEMRHAPFYGWIQDLSAPDPTSFVNLFGLLPFQSPEFLQIGIWPMIMGLTMYLQQKLNPQPTDPVQAKVFMFMPFIFTILLASFPAGLVIYWAWNNILSIAQQWVIMKRVEASKKKTKPA